MKCEVFVGELQRAIEESWDQGSLAVTDRMQDHVSECPRCQARLTAARALCGPDTGTVVAPAGLEDRILLQLNKTQAGSAGLPGARDKVSVNQARSRRRVMPLFAAAAALVLATAGITAWVLGPGRSDLVEVHLVLEAPAARSVAVVGDWNGWDLSAQPLTDRDGDGVWELRFRVEPVREYEYQFVVDNDEWVSDPRALLQVEDGFGGINSVLDI